MVELSKRIRALEARIKADPVATQPAHTVSQLNAVLARIEAMKVESARRKLLPLEEQLDLLRADRSAELEKRERERGRGTAVALRQLDVVRDKCFEHSERGLQEKIAARNGSGQ
jgi:hypothetical protein